MNARALGIAVLLLTAGGAHARADDDLLATYLQRHGLTRLLVAHLDAQLESTSDTVAQQQIASRLADAYAQLLAQNSQQDELFQQVQQKLRLLQRRFPSISRPELRLSVFQAQYQRANQAFERWIAAGREESARVRTEKMFADLNDQLEQWLAQLAQQQAQWQDNPTAVESGRVQQLETLALQGGYLAGWSHYYGAMCSLDEARRQWLQLAQTDFQQLLIIQSDEDIQQAKPEWFDFSVEWMARSMLGLAMTLQALGKEDSSDTCFRLLQQSQTHFDVLAALPLWRFHAAHFPGDLPAASELARQMQRSAEAASSIEFWVTVTIAGAVWPESGNAEARQLQLLGLAGLARNNQFALIDQLIGEYSIELPEQGFYAGWISGHRALERAEQTRQADDYRAAKLHLQQALAASDTDPSQAEIGRVRFLLAWSMYRTGDDTGAADQFRQASAALRRYDPAVASEALWMRIQSLQRIGGDSGQAAAELVAALDQLQNWFPDSPLARQAEFHSIRAQLRQLPAEQAIGRLAAIEPNDVNFQAAQVEICRLRHQLWAQAVEQGDPETPELADQLRSAARSVLQRNPPLSDAEQIQIALLAAQTHLCGGPLDLSAAENLLRTVSSAAQRLAGSDPVLSQFHYTLFDIARQRDDSPQADMQARWLADNGATSAHRRSGLVWLARAADAAYQAQPSAESRQQAMQLYQQLVDTYGTSVDSLNGSDNARVALAQLAQYQLESDLLEDAGRGYDQLLAAFPREREYLIRSARIKTQRGQWQAALELWRTLIAGLAAGSDLWLESKYNLIVCLQAEKDDSAPAVLDQTLRLAPQMPATWKTRFEELTGQMSQDRVR